MVIRMALALLFLGIATTWSSDLAFAQGNCAAICQGRCQNAMNRAKAGCMAKCTTICEQNRARKKM